MNFFNPLKFEMFLVCINIIVKFTEFYNHLSLPYISEVDLNYCPSVSKILLKKVFSTIQVFLVLFHFDCI